MTNDLQTAANLIYTINNPEERQRLTIQLIDAYISSLASMPHSTLVAPSQPIKNTPKIIQSAYEKLDKATKSILDYFYQGDKSMLASYMENHAKEDSNLKTKFQKKISELITIAENATNQKGLFTVTEEFVTCFYPLYKITDSNTIIFDNAKQIDKLISLISTFAPVHSFQVIAKDGLPETRALRGISDSERTWMILQSILQVNFVDVEYAIETDEIEVIGSAYTEAKVEQIGKLYAGNYEMISNKHFVWIEKLAMDYYNL